MNALILLIKEICVPFFAKGVSNVLNKIRKPLAIELSIYVQPTSQEYSNLVIVIPDSGCSMLHFEIINNGTKPIRVMSIVNDSPEELLKFDDEGARGRIITSCDNYSQSIPVNEEFIESLEKSKKLYIKDSAENLHSLSKEAQIKLKEGIELIRNELT